jgi:L-asparagine transporter-like permease
MCRAILGLAEAWVYGIVHPWLPNFVRIFMITFLNLINVKVYSGPPILVAVR